MKSVSLPFRYKFILGIIPLLLIYTLSFGQSTNVLHYNKDNGLYNEQIKSVAKDSLGFIWLATDNGLMKFDGDNFQHFPGDKLPSQYVKSILHRKNGELIAMTDNGMVQIYSTLDSTRFVTILRGGGTDAKTEKYIANGKVLYEDSKERLWAADDYKIYRKKGKSFKIYPFDIKLNIGDELVRSFSFTEDDKGNLYVMSLNGHLFKYNEETDKFDQISTRGTRLNRVQHIINVEKNKFLVADFEKGVVSLQINKKRASLSSIGNRFDASYIIRKTDETFWVTGWMSGLYEVKKEGNNYSLNRHPSLGVYNGANIYQDKKDTWISGDFGFYLIQELPFRTLADKISTKYIQDIVQYSDNTIAFTDGEFYYEGFLTSNNEFVQARKVSSEGRTFIRLLAGPTNDQVYTADAQGKIVLWKKGEVEKEYDLSRLGKAIFTIARDKKGNLWFCQDGVAGLIKLSPNGKTKVYGVDEGIITRPISITVTKEKGDIYIGGTSDNGYLFKYNAKKDNFENLSADIPFRKGSEMNVNDLVALNEEEGTLVIASSFGTMIYDDGKLKRLDLGGLTSNIAKSLAFDESIQDLWIATSNGLVRYQIGEDEYIVYTSKDGMPVNALNYRSLFVNGYGEVFGASPKGIAFADDMQLLEMTKVPLISKIMVSSTESPKKKVGRVPINSFLKVNFFVPEFPAEQVTVEYQIADRTGRGEWKQTSSTDGEILVSGLAAGNYFLNIRARKAGNFSWSIPASYRFEVYKQWYLQWWSWGIYGGAFIIALFVIVRLNVYRVEKERKKLEAQVGERTKEVENQKNELTSKKNELEKAFNRLKRSEAVLNHNARELEKAKKDAEKAASKLRDKNHALEETSRTVREQNSELVDHRDQIVRQNEVVKRQSEMLAQQNQKMLSSINYAKRIQNAVFGESHSIEDKIRNVGDDWDSFVYFNPRDMVSGDFYWFAERHGKYILVAADCTGHGIPGAFMSLIGNDLLHQIVQERGILDPGRILKSMHEMIQHALNQHEDDDSRDGMDISICVVNPKVNTIAFAGAGNPLYYTKKSEPEAIHIIKGERYGVGGKETKIKRVYNTHVLPLDDIDHFYIFTDGYQDQFGGPEGRKLMSKNFRQILKDIHLRPMEVQKNALKQFMLQWTNQGEYKQIDDMLVIGVKTSVFETKKTSESSGHQANESDELKNRMFL